MSMSCEQIKKFCQLLLIHTVSDFQESLAVVTEPFTSRSIYCCTDKSGRYHSYMVFFLPKTINLCHKQEEEWRHNLNQTICVPKQFFIDATMCAGHNSILVEKTATLCSFLDKHQQSPGSAPFYFQDVHRRNRTSTIIY